MEQGTYVCQTDSLRGIAIDVGPPFAVHRLTLHTPSSYVEGGVCSLVPAVSHSPALPLLLGLLLRVMRQLARHRRL